MKKSIWISTLMLTISTHAMATIQSVDLKGSCNDLAINDQKNVSIPLTDSSTKIQHSYTLVKIADEEYKVFFNYDFSFDKGYKITDGLKNISEVNSEFKKNIQLCFDKYNNRLEDELGRKIELNVYDAKNTANISRPRSVEIRVSWTKESDKFRADSRHYNNLIDCHTLIHEGLHLAGLVDEYKETAIKTIFRKKPKYNRRAVGPEYSIMRAPWELSNLSNSHVMFSGQTNTILYPNCFAKNSKYYTCAKLAYKSGDKEVPEFCQNENWVKID